MDGGWDLWDNVIAMIKNYTSGVAVETTMAQIEKVLVVAGATGFQKLYENRICIAIIFEIEWETGKRVAIKLPANVAQCCEALWRECVRNSPKTRKTKPDFYDQAARTAWKLVLDWVEVQVSLIHLKQLETLQAFMAYVWDGKTTYYQALKTGGFQKLLPQRVEHEIKSA